MVGEERDIVGVRTNYRDEDVYLYRLECRRRDARQLLLVYLARINELADRPEFYHLLSNSCTINIVRYANLVGRKGDFDFRHYLNGWVDQYFYDTRLLNTQFPFAELRRRSRVNPAVKASADVEDFSQHIRESVPGMESLNLPRKPRALPWIRLHELEFAHARQSSVSSCSGRRRCVRWPAAPGARHRNHLHPRLHSACRRVDACDPLHRCRARS